MADTYINVLCPHILEADSDVGEAGTKCEAEHELEAEVEPADPSYGADADGNRGMYVPAYPYEPDPPTSCDVCGCTYTEAELEDLRKQIKKKCDSWTPPDPYDYDEF